MIEGKDSIKFSLVSVNMSLFQDCLPRRIRIVAKETKATSGQKIRSESSLESFVITHESHRFGARFGNGGKDFLPDADALLRNQVSDLNLWS